jgi:hypothetical protein
MIPLQAVLRGEYEEEDTIIVEAVGNGVVAAAPLPGDGNYRSGLVLKKGPRNQPDTAASGGEGGSKAVAAASDAAANGHVEVIGNGGNCDAALGDSEDAEEKQA